MEPCDLDAVEARKQIGSKRLSPTELLDSCLRRIDRVNSQVNGIVAMNVDVARQEAVQAETSVMRGDALGPLHGLPVGIKDLINTAGLRTTFGSRATADNIPTKDDVCITRSRSAGGIVQFKTNTPEWGAGGNTFNAVYGVSGNPFDPRLTCGGSSGGSAIALALGMVPLAQGSDNAGSLRIPASYCGVVGMRPSAGVVPREERPVGLSHLATQGPMARTVADMMLLFSVLTSDGARDSLYARPIPDFDAMMNGIDLSGLRVATSSDLGGFASVDASIRATFLNRVKAVEGSFLDVAVDSPDLRGADRTYEVLRSAEFLGRYSETLHRSPESWPKLVADNMKHAAGITAEDIGVALSEQQRLFAEAQRFFSQFDLLITPTVALGPWPKHEMYPASVSGHESSSYIDWVRLTYAFSLLGFPSVSLPSGKTEGGLPFGLQLVAPRLSDVWLCRVAMALEDVLSGDAATGRPAPDIDWLAAQEAEDPLARQVV